MNHSFSETNSEDRHHMELALQEARNALAKDEVPVGAVVVCGREVIGRGYNRREELQEPTGHAEILALRDASSYVNSWRLEKSTIYVTLEPCVMCVGAILQARILRLVFGCPDPKGGAVESLFSLCNDPRLNHRVSVTRGVLQEECAEILKGFFSSLRQNGRANA
ncbi:MAG: tRNA adenosine(34) deaminase TadA [Candidatus Binatia bacterium]